MNFKPFGYNRISLMIPEKWDLSRATGNSQQGELVLDDGIEPRLNVQWVTGKDLSMELLAEKWVTSDKYLNVLREDRLDPNHWCVQARTDLGKVSMSIVFDRHENRGVMVRLFRPKGHPQGLAQTMVQPLLDGPEKEGYRWRFFATDFCLGREFELHEAVMKAGVNRLTFKNQKRDLTLWDFSLLDQVEKRVPISSFAMDLVKREYPKQYVIDNNTLLTKRDPVNFSLYGRMRIRWMLHPGKLFFGNRHALIEGCANRQTNRFSVLFWRYRHTFEEDWIASLAASLRRDVSERVSA